MSKIYKKETLRITSPDKLDKISGGFIGSYKSGDIAVTNRADAVKWNRHLFLNNAIHKALIQSLVSMVLGTDGVEVIVNADEQVKQDLSSVLAGFYRNADLTKINYFTELERLILTELLVAGEVLVLKVREKRALQIIETERIKEVILSDTTGEIVAFHIYDEKHEKGYIEIKKKNAIFLSLVDRPSQIRGVGILTPALDVIGLMGSVMSSSAAGMAVVSKHALIVKKRDAEETAAAMSYSYTGGGEEDDDSEDEQDEIIDPVGVSDMGDALIFWSNDPDADLHAVNHNGVPNDKLAEHLLTYCRVISSTCGLDAAAVILHDFSQYSYSSSKASSIGMRRTVNRIQNLLVHRLYRPVFNWIIGSEIANPDSPIEDVTLLDKYECVLPVPPVADDKSASKNIQTELESGITTHEKVLAERNIDRKTFLSQRKDEIMSAIEVAKEIEEKTGMQVPYEIFCGAPLSKTAMAKLNEEDEERKPNE